MKPVMINVDDLGLSAPVNEAVVWLAEMGRIHATSFMSQGLIAADIVNKLHKLNIDIGLHLDLTGFNALGSLKKILITSYLHLWQKKVIENHINQQLDKFEDIIGSKPVFIDGHQHVHQFPQISSILINIIEQRYGNNVAIRSTKPIQKDFKARLIYHLGGQAMDRIMQKKHIAHNSAFAGVYNFNTDINALASKWTQWLQAVPEAGAIIMCHPAIPARSWQDKIKNAREQECKWLTSNTFWNCWQEENCYGINWQKFHQCFNNSSL